MRLGLVLGYGNAFGVESGPECWGGGRGYPPPPFQAMPWGEGESGSVALCFRVRVGCISLLGLAAPVAVVSRRDVVCVHSGQRLRDRPLRVRLAPNRRQLLANVFVHWVKVRVSSFCQ